MKHPHQSMAPTLITASRKLAEFGAARTGTITDVYLKSTTNNAAGPATFDVRINGVSIYGQIADRPSILTSAYVAVQSALTTPVNKGDIISIWAMTVPAGGIGGSLICQIDIEDGTGGGGTGGDPALGGDLSGLASDATVEKIQNIPVYFPSVQSLASTFDGNVLDPNLWEVHGSLARVTQVNELRIGVLASLGGGQSNGVNTKNAFNFSAQDSFVQIDINRTLQASVADEFWIVDAANPTLNYAAFLVSSNYFVLRVANNGVLTDDNITNSFATKWRIRYRSSDNKFYFEGFVNNAWAVLSSITANWVPNNVKARIWVETGPSITSDTTLVIDNLTSNVVIGATIEDESVLTYILANNRIEARPSGGNQTSGNSLVPAPLSWKPSDEATTALWLRHHTLDGIADETLLETWNDSSGHARHATQATQANRPTVYRSLNQNIPGLNFTSGSTQKLVTPSFSFQHLFVVARYSVLNTSFIMYNGLVSGNESDAAGLIFVGDFGAMNWYSTGWTDGPIVRNDGLQTNDAGPFGQFHIYEISRNSGWNAGLLIGNDRGFARGFGGEVLEVLAFSTVAGTALRRRAIRYLAEACKITDYWLPQ